MSALTPDGDADTPRGAAADAPPDASPADSPADPPPGATAGNSVGKTVRVLAALGRLGGFGRLTEIADAAGVPKASTHRILATLIAEGFVTSDGSRRYGPGTGLRALAANIAANEQHGIEAVLQRLQARVGHTVHLAVLSGDQATITYVADAGRVFQIAWHVGTRLPLHATALGKAILAHLDPHEADEIIVRTGLPALTEHTITDPRRLGEHLARVRERGYAADSGESDDVLCTIAAPVLSAEGRPLGAVSIAALAPLTPPRELEELAPEVCEAAGDVARRS
ncbi:IclR family transcriptional regulator [Nocardiopsis mangrovi]|uniref:IclR family transcriptional regulator n=1 Tax=Nocardiopsis mangrovi TaxID=1179818 RepID=A0ABV9DYX9_9ACTN